MRSRLQTIAAGTLLSLLCAAPVLAKCRVSAEEGVSRNGLVKVVPALEGECSILVRTKPDAAFVLKKKAAMPLFGHHVKTLVPNSGTHFVLFDPYAGLEFHRADGTLLKRLEPETLLSAKELTSRPGSFACHPEGVWTESEAALAPGERSVRVKLYTGKVMEFSLDGVQLAAPQARR